MYPILLSLAVMLLLLPICLVFTAKIVLERANVGDHEPRAIPSSLFNRN